MRVVVAATVLMVLVSGPDPAQAVAGADPAVFGERDVLYVTSLADSGPGSLRDVLGGSSGPRDIVFDVGGVIELRSNLKVDRRNVRILGETAPPPGITLRGATFEIKRGAVFVSNIAIRVGPGLPGDDVDNRDGIAITGSSNFSDCSRERDMGHIILDHVSVTWSVDENVQLWGCNIHHVTISNSIIAEALNRAGHSKGQHSMGLLVGGTVKNVLIYRNLFVSNIWRNPVVTDETSTAIINNLIYNPGGRAVHIYPGGTGLPTRLSVIGNKIVGGPSLSGNLRMGQGKRNAANPGSVIYMIDNLVEGNISTLDVDAVGGLKTVQSPPVTWPASLHIVRSSQLEDDLLQTVGPEHRDATDRRLIEEVRQRRGSTKNTPPPDEWRAPPQAR